MARYHSLLSTTALSMIALGLAAPVDAYDYEDDASQAVYADGLDNGDNANTGTLSFSPWIADATFVVESSANDGGAGVIDVGGLSWRFQSDASSPFDGTRAFSDGQPVGTKISVSLEAGTTTSTSFTNFAGLQASGVGAANVSMDETSSFWQIFDDADTTTTISYSTPIRVIWTLQAGSTYDVELQPLPSGTPYVSTGRTYTASGVKSLAKGGGGPALSSAINQVKIRTYDSDGTGSTPATIYANSLIVDPSGSLPVELDSYSVE